jgi:polar amino acid transport system permease protein
MRWDVIIQGNNIKRLMIGDFPGGEVGGLILTLYIGILSIIASTFFGIILAAMRVSNRKYFKIPATIYIETIRGLPLMMIIFWVYFIPPLFGFERFKIGTVVLSITIITSAYIAEIVRGGLKSIDKGQEEAGYSIGLSYFQVMVYIILPQALKNMIPALTGRYMMTLKNTSLAFLIGLSDLTGIGKEINDRVMTAPFEVYSTILIIYFIVNRFLSFLSLKVEKTLSEKF